MNAVANATETKTYTEEERAAYKKAVADLKERIKNLAAWQRHNKALFKDHQRRVDTGDRQYIDINGKPTPRYSKRYWDQYITTLHIVYNRLRNRPPHLGSREKDDFYISGENPALYFAPSIYRDLVEEIRDKYGFELGKEVE